MGIVIRIKPNASQRELLEKHFGHNRWLWNYFLEKRKREYQENKKGSTYIKDAKALTVLRNSVNYGWLAESSVSAQQRTLKNLDDAYKRFYNRHSKFPTFKSKKWNPSYSVADKVRVKDNKIYFPKFTEGIKFNRILPFFDKLNNITIRKTSSGRYYAILSVEADKQSLPSANTNIGLDLGLIDFAVLSNGKRIKAPKFYRKQQVALKRAQQHLSRKKKGSSRWNKQRIKVAKIHEKITNSRKNFLHKYSASIIKDYGVIAVEDLAVKNLVKNHKLAKSISDAGWSEFLRQLEYKAKWYGREFVRIGRFYPSSKACSECGYIQQGMRLEHRKWTCSGCGVIHDRDLNAARNILREGLRELSERLSPSTIMEAV